MNYVYARRYDNTITGTYAFMVTEDYIAIGYAKVNPNEQAAKAVGRNIAEDRMYDALELLGDMSNEILTIDKLFPNEEYTRLIGLASSLPLGITVDNFGRYGVPTFVEDAILRQVNLL